MNERASHPPKIERFSRRDVTKAFLSLGAVALYAPAKEAYVKVRSIGNDYSNDPFLGNATRIDRARLNTLLAGDSDLPLPSVWHNKENLEQFDTPAEHLFMLDSPGPVHATFDGLIGDKTSLVILRASVDEHETFLIPIIRDPHDHEPVTVQLGVHEAGEHSLRLSVEQATTPVMPSEVVPHFTRGSDNQLRRLIDQLQPDIYPRLQKNKVYNTPLRSLCFVYEHPDSISLVYWQECSDEDKEYGRFGSSVQQLISTKNRPTDIDWIMETTITHDGVMTALNIQEPYHTRTALTPGDLSHTPLRIASRNNNVEPVTDSWHLQAPKIRFRPHILTHDERWQALYSTSPSAARLSICENIQKGTLNPRRASDAAIIERFGVTDESCGS